MSTWKDNDFHGFWREGPTLVLMCCQEKYLFSAIISIHHVLPPVVNESDPDNLLLRSSYINDIYNSAQSDDILHVSENGFNWFTGTIFLSCVTSGNYWERVLLQAANGIHFPSIVLLCGQKSQISAKWNHNYLPDLTTLRVNEGNSFFVFSF